MANILLVDDNGSVRTMNKLILEAGDHTVFAAGDGFQAQELFKSEDIELLILDIDMPIMNGFEVLQTIREDNPDSEFGVLMLTASGMLSDRVSAKKYRVDQFLEKPIRSHELLHAVGIALKKRAEK